MLELGLRPSLVELQSPRFLPPLGTERFVEGAGISETAGEAGPPGDGQGGGGVGCALPQGESVLRQCGALQPPLCTCAHPSVSP